MVSNRYLQIVFALSVAALLAAHAGAAVRVLYPAAALMVAARLVATSTPDYVSFVIWLWALSPLVRRVADAQAGWQEASLILLTPYLATALGALRATLATVLDPTRKTTLPYRPTMFILAGIGTACGAPLGFVLGTPGAVPETLNWLVPVLFGAYVATAAGEALAIEEAVVATFAKVAVVVGAYGIYQFFHLPSWDAAWMINSEMTSIGAAEALSVRVFSTMHSPGVLGYFIYLPVVFWLADPKLTTLLPAGLASVTLLLSQVRSAWTALAVSAVLLLFVTRASKGLRVIVLAGVGALCIAPLLRLPDVSERVNARVDTFRDMPNFDTSATARTEGYVLTFDFMLRHPFGAGVGANPAELDVVGVRDSTIISGLVQFGILGMLVYGASILLMIGCIWHYYRSSAGPPGVGLAAGALGMMSIMALGIPTAAQPGVFTWLVAGLATARARERASAHLDDAAEPFTPGVAARMAPAGGR